MSTKKGYTLIEVIMVIFLLAVICSITSISYKGYKSISSDIESDYYIENILNFINNAREFCRENNTVGSIVFNKELNTIFFQIHGNTIRSLNLGNELFLKDIALNRIFNSNSIMLIKNSGMISNPGSIYLIDKKGEEHIITICVGTSYVRIKK
ncbi:hypothetical protein CLTEP_00680 [Clostridium tepidiprofundi DSM 19306]|uniref:Prepilin-type N-terminal cleavage/methylation domain-containing protein n=1 Tax=Clostridium tepidiprofundi DSM 19306 TaxID=1121338 RepID=A0A151B6X5_9CLOT|nr:prepilin-type N-terminal cleavage/methylation domain-containing protein [Clostridium tepidiprofundi]KYH35675.1 hypothetical protein CLTEP_00680 [Clostridium tepidiprofundi DSM 19306]